MYSINTAQIAELTKVPLAGSYLQLVDQQPGGLGVLGVPHLDAGPFLSYGIQWISFGILAPIGVGYFVYSEIKARRREKQASATQARPPSRKSSPTATGAPPAVSHQRGEQRGPRLDQARQHHGAAQVGHVRLPPVAQGGPDLQLVAILRRPAEPNPQRPGEGRLHDAGVGAGVPGGVTTPRAQRPRR